MKTMIKKKICLLGSFGVGKTSLIEKYVFNIFSETYLSTIGVKVDKKEICLEDGRQLILMVWDLAGQEEGLSPPQSYLQGMSGYLLVADGTRRDSLDMTRKIYHSLQDLYRDIPFRLLINKADLMEDWKIEAQDYDDYTQMGVEVLLTSAKDGTAVEEAFLGLAKAMLESDGETE